MSKNKSLKNFPRRGNIKPNSSPKNQNSKNFLIQFYQNRLNNPWLKLFKKIIKNYTNARSAVFTIPIKKWQKSVRRGAGSTKAATLRLRLMLRRIRNEHSYS